MLIPCVDMIQRHFISKALVWLVALVAPLQGLAASPCRCEIRAEVEHSSVSTQQPCLAAARPARCRCCCGTTDKGRCCCSRNWSNGAGSSTTCCATGCPYQHREPPAGSMPHEGPRLTDDGQDVPGACIDVGPSRHPCLAWAQIDARLHPCQTSLEGCVQRCKFLL